MIPNSKLLSILKNVFSMKFFHSQHPALVSDPIWQVFYGVPGLKSTVKT